MNLYSYSYSIPYIIVVLLLFILACLEDKSIAIKKNKYISIAAFILLIFFGLRGFVQSDFQNYYPWFEYLPTIWESGKFYDAFSESFEPGFVLCSILCKSLNPDYFFWVFVCVLIDIILLKKIFKQYSVNVCLSFSIYFALGAIIMEFNLMRNIKAILILFFAIKYIQNKQIWKYFACVFLASLFHITSIIFVPLYFILNKKWPKPILLGIFILCIIVLVFKIRFLSVLLPKIAIVLGGEYLLKSESYSASGELEATYGITFGLIERIITYVLVFRSYGTWSDKTGNRYIFPNMIIIYFMCFSLLTEMSVLLERFAYYFVLSYSIFYPNLIKQIKVKVNRTLLVFFVVSVFTLKVAQQTQTIVCKYDNLLFGIESFEIRSRTLDIYIANTK